MSDQVLSCHDYVNHPYPRVRDLLLADPYLAFRRATAAAASGQTAKLQVRIAGVDLGTEVTIDVVGIENDYAYERPATKIALEWRAVRSPRVFPAMKADLLLFALSATETQLELRGSYQPPMGKLGDALDAAAGHRIAEASVTQFLQQVAGWLREQLGPSIGIATVEQPPRPFESVLDTEC
jgi:hypothetical protein